MKQYLPWDLSLLSTKGNAMIRTALLVTLLLGAAAPGQARAASACVECHAKKTPNIVTDWQSSRHSESGIDCFVCHGGEHTAAGDAGKARIPTPDTCAMCHSERVKQYKAGKHAQAWAAMKAMPAIHYQPSIMIEGMKGCGGCHKIGLKTAAEIADLKKNSPGFGTASCDSCHTRHIFSTVEARQPQACQTCHMGFDHPQWEMYSSSKHGVRYLLKQNKTLPESVAAPTCQNCHMQNKDHGVMTAWGFLALRLPMSGNVVWQEDRITIMRAMGLLDAAGKPTKRMESIRGIRLFRTSEEEWQKERDKTIAGCNQCHSVNFAKSELEKGDRIIADADHLLAEAIRLVGGLYKDGLLKKPDGYDASFPDLLSFQNAPTPIEQRLYVMFLEHRNRAFQGMFHASPDYAWWYGYSELQSDLTEIRHMAEEIRRAGK